jgi:hypothetical protein
MKNQSLIKKLNWLDKKSHYKTFNSIEKYIRQESLFIMFNTQSFLFEQKNILQNTPP